MAAEVLGADRPISMVIKKELSSDKSKLHPTTKISGDPIILLLLFSKIHVRDTQMQATGLLTRITDQVK
jgi:hypothetical protein